MNVIPQNWIDNPGHHRWLEQQTEALLAFYSAVPDTADGGFLWLDQAGRPVPEKGKQLWLQARFTYSFAIGHLLARPGYAKLVQHGLDYLRSGPVRDLEHGGWFTTLDVDGTVTDDTKQTYPHAFVLLAATAAITAGFDAQDLFDDALEVLLQRFWNEDEQMFVDTWNRDFTELDEYRGQNSNMHLVEALLAAHDLTGRADLLATATHLAEVIVRDTAAHNQWRIPERFTPEWTFRPELNTKNAGNAFRGAGYAVGHWLEWTRLLVHLDAAHDGGLGWAPAAAAALFDRAIADGWAADGSGFGYITDNEGSLTDTDRYHWVIAEAVGAAAALHARTGQQGYADWYARFWEYAEEHTIDHVDRSWRHQLNAENEVVTSVWDGKPDLYHSLQATLLPRLPIAGSIVSNLAAGALR